MLSLSSTTGWINVDIVYISTHLALILVIYFHNLNLLDSILD